MSPTLQGNFFHYRNLVKWLESCPLNFMHLNKVSEGEKFKAVTGSNETVGAYHSRSEMVCLDDPEWNVKFEICLKILSLLKMQPQTA